MPSDRFFTPDMADPNFDDIIDCVVEASGTLRKNDTETKFVCKLPEGHVGTPACLQPYTEFDHAGILVEMAKPEWNNDEE